MNLIYILIQVVHLLIALSFHESAHAFMAYRLGDPTAKARGRITMNPLKHIDPIGTIILPLMLIAFRAPFVFGWAKPTPVNPAYFRDPRKGQLYTALAGPSSNLILTLFFVLSYHVTTFLIRMGPQIVVFRQFMSFFLVFFLLGAFLNFVLFLFNLIPLYPLDGSWVLEGLLPLQYLRTWYKFKPYSPFLLLIIIALPAFDVILLRFFIIPFFTLMGIPLGAFM